ncbi:MAG TPA: hypothetical protein GXZ43_04010 [Clostridiaceae bacterium]|nr:hypothetical protein [Clostridiaceae bacterium]
MRFSDWLNQIQNKLKFKNIEIADCSGIHASTISRYRRGARSPVNNQDHLNRIVSGIIKLAEERNQISELCELVECQQYAHNKSELFNELLKISESFFLKEIDDDTTRPENYVPDFDRKLDFFMQTFSISNARLANALNLDNSLISRWRNGARLLKNDNPALETMINYFTNIIEKKQNYKLTMPQQHFIAFIEKGPAFNTAENLASWFLSIQNESIVVQQNVKNILDKINDWHGNKLELIQPDSVYFQTLGAVKKQESYRGIAGLREAVIRFFTDIILSEEKRKLQLFSNQEMDWLATDKNFMQTWLICMNTIVKQGHEIEIIHYLGRSPEEITLGIEKWLPLHMNVNVTAYTCDSLNLSGNRNPLVKTLFIDAGNAAINAEMIRGAEDQSEYHYYTSYNKLKDLSDQFEQLQRISEPIMYFYKSDAIFSEEIIKTWQKEGINKSAKEEADQVILLYPTIPMCFFPDIFIKEILSATNLDNRTVSLILTENEKLRLILKKFLTRGEIFLIGPFDDQVRSDLIVLLPHTNDVKIIKLSREQFQIGLDSLHKYQKEFANLKVINLHTSPFKNLHALSFNKHTILLRKMSKPHLLIRFQHQLSVTGLNRYLKALAEQSGYTD